MLTYQCTSCGGSVTVADDVRIGKCPVCGSLFVLPNQFANKQNIYRLAAEALANRNFDVALTYYSRILKVDATETAAHWGFLLSKYGVEISDQADTYQNIIFHRLEHSRFTEDPSYEKMITYCPKEALYYYQGLSRQIDQRQRRMLEISGQVREYDLYINCVAQPGTADYLLANQVGKTLDEAGYKVFLPCTMLNKVPQEDKNLYEMAVAEKAAAMIVIVTAGTNLEDPRYQAVWKRFLAYRRQDAGRKMLSVYQDIQPEQLPLELQPLQSIPASGADTQEAVLTQINKMFGRQNQDAAMTKKILQLLRRGNEFLKQKNFKSAANLFRQARELNAEEPEAHWGLVCAATQGLTTPVLSEQVDTDYQRALQFSQGAVRERYRQEMGNLMQEPAWENLMKVTENLTRTRLEGQADAEQAIRWVYLYMSKDDPRLKRIEDFRGAAKMEREAAAIKGAYERRDTAVQPLFAEQTKAENEYTDCKILHSNVPPAYRTVGWFAALSVLLLLASQVVLVQSYTYSLSYSGPLYTAAKVLFIAAMGSFVVGFCLLWKYIAEQKDWKFSHCLLAAAVFCLAVWFLYGRKTQLTHLIALVVAAAAWLAVCIVTAFYAGLATKELSARQKARNRVEDLNRQIQNAYQQQMQAHYTKYGKPDHKIPEYQVKNSSSFGYSSYNPKTIHPVFYLIRNGLVLAAAIALVTLASNSLYASGWEDIVSVAPAAYHVVGLRSDGTVIANGRNDHGQCEVSGWEDIVQVETGSLFTAGLKADGTVCVAGDADLQDAVAGWRNVVQINASNDHVVGLKSDGTCVAAGSNSNGECEVSGFSDVKIIRAVTDSSGSLTIVVTNSGAVQCTNKEDWQSIQSWLSNHTGSGEDQLKVTGLYGEYGALIMTTDDGTCQGIGSNSDSQLSKAEDWDANTMLDFYICNFTLGLKKDGTVEFAGNNSAALTQVSQWRDIIALTGGDKHVLALRSDGTVAAAGNNDQGQCNTGDWTDIQAISASPLTSYGVRSDGTVEATGYGMRGIAYLTPRSPIGVLQFWLETANL